MPLRDWLLLMGMGGIFIILGLISYIIGVGEERGYYLSLFKRPDVREFFTHDPPRPFLGALKIGGRVAMVVGAVMLIIGAVFWFRDRIM